MCVCVCVCVCVCDSLLKPMLLKIMFAYFQWLKSVNALQTQSIFLNQNIGGIRNMYLSMFTDRARLDHQDHPEVHQGLVLQGHHYSAQSGSMVGDDQVGLAHL